MMKRNESGFTLVGVLAVFSILSVFGISLVMLSISSVKTSNNEHDDQSVFYIAEAGANYMANEIEQEAKEIYDNSAFSSKEELHTKLYDKVKDINKPSFTFEKTDRGEPTANITVEETLESSSSKYIITSTGTIGNQSRTVTQTVEVGWPVDEDDGGDGDGGSGGGLLPPFAVYTLGKDLHLQKDLSVIGNIGTSSFGTNDIKINNNVNLNNIGNIYLPKDNKDILKYKGDFGDDKKSGRVVIMDMDEIPKFPALPEFPKPLNLTLNNKLEIQDGDTHDIGLSGDIAYKKIELQNNSTINFNIGNEDKTIMVEELKIDNGHIKIEGDGTLTLLILKSGDIENDNSKRSTVNLGGKINQLNIYSQGHFRIRGDSVLRGSIYIKDGHLKLDHAAELYGNIFIKDGNLDVEENSKIHSEIILVPNSKVDIQESHINGPIISDSFQMQNGSLNHKPPFTLDGPLSFKNLKNNDGSDFQWPDKGQGTGEGGGSSKPDGGPSISIPPIKEIPNN